MMINYTMVYHLFKTTEGYLSVTPLEQAIAEAYASQGQQADVNRVHLLLLQTKFYLPVQKEHTPTEEEPFRPLFAVHEKHIFMLAFEAEDQMAAWAAEQAGEIAHVQLSGRDLVVGIGENVFLVLNPGAKLSKEFSPEELQYLKKIVARIEQMN
ncbi:MAG: SseB family protein [Gammaproteobacteria bacterium]|nr:SseB family protein [Gammaproteobacteria bacterium]